MKKKFGEHSESLPTGIFQLPGEPAIVVNGLPVEPLIADAAPLNIAAGNAKPSNTVDINLPGNASFGMWLVGRGVCKLFENHYYLGTVTGFDSENKWYRVEYEDGDSEDLYWHELTEVLLPLDITVTLKSLAQKVAKMSYPKGAGSKAKRIKPQGGSSSTK